MPAQYEAIKKNLMASGMNEARAKQHAAMIYNADQRHKNHPVTRNYDKKK